MLFAAETPTADFTLQALLLAGLVLQALVAWAQLAGRKDAQRRQVSFETEFATKQEMHDLRTALLDLSTKLSDLKDSIVANGETRRKDIESKVAGVSDKVDDLRADVGHKLEAMGKSLSDLAVSQAATRATISAFQKSQPHSPAHE